MNNEKMKILQMLESGKITADQAAKLLEAAGTGSTGGAGSTGKNNFEFESAKQSNYTESANQYHNSSNAGGSSQKGVGLDDFVNELSRKFDVLAKDWEPKLKKFTGVVVEKTSDIADKFSKTIESHQKTSSTTTAKNSTSKNFEISVSAGYNEINLSGLNANVSVRGYNGDKITLKTNYKSNSPNAPINLVCFGNRYTLNYDESDFQSVAIDAFIPESMFDIVCVDTTNGNMDVSSIKTKFFKADCMDKDAIFRDISSENIKIENSNGKLSLQNLKSENAQIENSNGEISASNLDISKMKLSTSNAGVVMNIGNFLNYEDYIWSVETNNAKAMLNIPMSSEIGYHLKCQTILNSVKIGLVGLNFLVNDGPLAEAKSFNYDASSKKVKIAVETSNAPIIIN